MRKPVHGVLLNAFDHTIGEHTLSGTLDSYYKALNCNCFDIVSRKIGGEYYSIYCDDEGLLKDAPVITGVSRKDGPMLVGSLFICKHDEEGDTVSLTDAEIRSVLAQASRFRLLDGSTRPFLWMEY